MISGEWYTAVRRETEKSAQKLAEYLQGIYFLILEQRPHHFSEICNFFFI